MAFLLFVAVYNLKNEYYDPVEYLSYRQRFYGQHFGT